MADSIEASLVAQAGSLIEQRLGLAARTQLRAALQGVLHDLADGDLPTYLRLLRESHETDAVWQTLVAALTIGETYFFRDKGHFRLLRNHLLPTLILQRRQQDNLQLSIWSAGCATGEEPYSLAITLHELIPDLERWTVHLVGSDLNAQALEVARRGVYRNWAFRQTDETFRQRYFVANGHGLQIKPQIREMVTFRHTNLLSDPPLPQLDVILCRNVLIYFENPFVRAVENSFYDTLAPGGWLLLGPAEALHSQRERWITHIFPGAVVYQKPEHSAQPATFYQRHTQPPPEPMRPEEVEALPEPSYADCVRALRDEAHQEAERCLAVILAQHPNHAPAHTLLAFVFANRHALPEAHAHLDEALRLDPLWADAHYLRAMLFMEEGQMTRAEKALRAALYCQRSHPLAAFTLGNLYAQTGAKEKARRAWENLRQTIDALLPESYLSDLSDMTAADFAALLTRQIEQVAGSHSPMD